jgi:ketosteroid isomerase-like protein
VTEAALAALGIPDATVLARAPGESGWPVWHVAHGGREYALRELPEALARDEAALHRTAAAGGVPVPAVCAEAPGLLLLEWCRGVTLLEAVDTDPEVLGRAFGETQAMVHAVAAPTWLHHGGPAPGRALLHGDYHPLNVLTDGERITAVLDWSNAAAGDPRSDVARTFSILRLEARMPGRFPPALRRSLAAFERGWLRGLGGVVPEAAFCAWAGDFLAEDMAEKRPPEYIAQVRAWADGWRRWGMDEPERVARQALRDADSMLRLVAADLEWTFLDPSEADPQPRVCHGPDHLVAVLRRRAAQGLRSEFEEVVARGDRVLVVEHTVGLDAHRARQAHDRNFYVLTVRGGRIVALRACRDRAEAAALAGFSPARTAPPGPTPGDRAAPLA